MWARADDPRLRCRFESCWGSSDAGMKSPPFQETSTHGPAIHTARAPCRQGRGVGGGRQHHPRKAGRGDQCGRWSPPCQGPLPLGPRLPSKNKKGKTTLRPPVLGTLVQQVPFLSELPLTTCCRLRWSGGHLEGPVAGGKPSLQCQLPPPEFPGPSWLPSGREACWLAPGATGLLVAMPTLSTGAQPSPAAFLPEPPEETQAHLWGPPWLGPPSCHAPPPRLVCRAPRSPFLACPRQG